MKKNEKSFGYSLEKLQYIPEGGGTQTGSDETGFRRNFIE